MQRRIGRARTTSRTRAAGLAAAALVAGIALAGCTYSAEPAPGSPHSPTGYGTDQGFPPAGQLPPPPPVQPVPTTLSATPAVPAPPGVVGSVPNTPAPGTNAPRPTGP